MNSCCVCLKPKANLNCGICSQAVCKSCAQFLDENHFSFLAVIPDELQHSTYCSNCFDQKVAPELVTYNETMARAKDINVFLKNQTKESRLLKGSEEIYKVENCEDRKETLLRLAFKAAQANVNALINVDLVSTKVKIGTYQRTMWSGSGVPAHLPDKKETNLIYRLVRNKN
jgi:uncharacterized protein YbjQ (UPF0145 family)